MIIYGYARSSYDKYITEEKADKTFFLLYYRVKVMEKLNQNHVTSVPCANDETERYRTVVHNK